MLHAQQHAQHIGVEGGRVALCGLLGYGAALLLSPGVVDGDIQAAEACNGLIDQAAHVVIMAHVRTPILSLRAELADFSGQFLAGFVASSRR